MKRKTGKRDNSTLKNAVVSSLSIVIALLMFSCSPPTVDDTGNGGGTTDTTAPSVAITSPNSDITINSNNYTVAGTASDAGGLKAVYFKLNTGVFVSLGATANWSTNCSLVEGPNTVYVYAEDNTGNISTTNSVIITMNTGAPVITDISPANFYTTNGTPITISGVTTITNTPDIYNITNIEVSVNSETFVSITNGGNNVVEWSTSMTLTNGTNSITIRAYADNGKDSESSPLYVIYDTNGPTLANITPTNNQFVYKNYALQGNVSDDYAGVSKVYVKLDNGSFAEANISSESWSTNFNGLSSTSHTNWVYAEDATGNISATNEIVIVIVSKKLISYNGASNDNFGYSVAMSSDGNTVIVGTRGDDSSKGSAYWLRTSDDGISWTTNNLTAYDGDINDRFGCSVAMSSNGNTVIVGTRGDDSSKGSAYWFHTSDGGSAWTTNKLIAYDGAASDEFGNSVAMSADGNTVIVGACIDNGYQGSAYWFHTSDNGISWITNKLFAYDRADFDFFGVSVAMSDDGNTVIVGACRDGINSGSAYWLRTSDSGTNWITNKLLAYDGADHDEFGVSVAMSADGNTLIIGAYDDDPPSGSGSTYWFRTSDGGTNWTTNKITAYDAASTDRFGYSVAMSADGNTVIVGAHEDDDDGSGSGSAYWLCTSDGGSSWTTNKITAYDGDIDDHFGYSVAMSSDGNGWIVGAYLDDDNDDSGSVYWWGE